ncbi:MAG: NADH-quinone oxidoreductase subunit C [Actinomycetota bacterium]|nr:NADH-quinone oxidoreductase subunit C [Actinomycetota bacterium]
MSDANDTALNNDTLALPGDALREGVVTALRDALGEGLLDSLIKPNDDIWVRVTNEAWQQAGRVLRDIVGCDYFCFLSAIDWMPSPFGKGEDDPTAEVPERDTEIKQGYTGGDTRLQVFARVTNTSKHFGVTLKADVPDEAPAIETWIPVYAGANWHERECHEMFGIGFTGHPDLRNMYLPTGFEGHPLRKDFPLLARMVKPWPGIADVEPLPGDDSQDEDA